MFTANSLRWALALLLSSLIAIARATLNYSTCLDNVKNGQYLNLNYSNDSGGAMDSQGHFLNLSDPNLNRSAIVAMPYGVCIACGGSGPEAFDWSTFATNFSAWLLPFLALVSQLPFGSQLRQQNILSIFLTIGSPALAAYSLVICVLNWAEVPRAFEGIQYPNVEHAWRILGSLQHSPLYITHDSWTLASLVTLPENDQWWKSLAKGLDYEETWKTAVILQTAWVIIAFVFTVVDSFNDGLTDGFGSSGRGTGTLLLWLLPLVVGWQRLSPRCDYARVRDALERSNESVYVFANSVTTPTVRTSLHTSGAVPFPTPMPPDARLSPPATRNQGSSASLPPIRRCRTRFPFALERTYDDREASAPIYSYSRLLPWSANVDLVAGAFRVAADVMAAQDVDPTDAQVRRRFIFDVSRRLQQRTLTLDWSAIVWRCVFAGVMAMALHWGAIGSAILYSFYTPRSGLGCRAASFTLYGVVGMLIWIVVVSSSFITHYAQWRTRQQHLCPRRSVLLKYGPSSRFAHRLAKLLCASGKILAVLNAIWIVTACIFLFTNFYVRCWCDSSALGRGINDTYVIVTLRKGDFATEQLRRAWVGALTLSLGSVAIFIGFVYMHVKPVSPDPNSMQPDEPRASADELYPLLEPSLHRDNSLVGDFNPHGPEILGHSPEGTYFEPFSPPHSREGGSSF
ncbi:hypothetical protein PENSPDRAFT_683287 [Peniophora sp. CONT]|nr:hypothetical protein PENSPDRAFT_683287 [Peniophora sp. CONT]